MDSNSTLLLNQGKKLRGASSALFSALVFLTMVFSGLNLTAQEVQQQFLCGEDRIIDVEIQGLLNASSNCVSVSNTSNMVGAMVEVWIENDDCSGNLPSSIRITAGGQTRTAEGIPAVQSQGNIPEYIYRTSFTGSFNQVCISDLNGCSSATSMALYVERESNGSSATSISYDLEFHENGCETVTVDVGEGGANRNFEIRVPIHEKSDDGRPVRIEAEALDGNNVVRTIGRNYTEQNRGAEASFFVLDLNNVTASADRVRVRVCSQPDNGDSFGVGTIVVASENCQPFTPQVCETCPVVSSCNFDRAFSASEM